MIPEKYIRDLESSERRRKILRHILVSAVFLTFFLLVGPVIHELAHVSLLELKDCIYRFSPHFSVLNGFYAEADPLCSLGSTQQAVFYSSGYLSTLLIGAALTVLAVERKSGRLSDFFAASGTGMLLSVLLTVGVEGDIQNLLEALEIDPAYGSLVSLFVILGVFLSSLKGAQILLRLEGEE